MKLDSNILFKQFFNKIKEQYPDKTLEEITDICKANWEYIAVSMASGELPIIRQKYFGTFLPYPNRVKGMIQKLIDKFNKGNMEEEKFLEIKNNLETYLNDTKD